MDFLATRITSSYCATVNLGFYGDPSYKETPAASQCRGRRCCDGQAGQCMVCHWHVPRGRRRPTCSVSARQWQRHNVLDKSPHKRTVGPRPIKATATATTIPENKDRVTALRWHWFLPRGPHPPNPKFTHPHRLWRVLCFANAPVYFCLMCCIFVLPYFWWN